MLIHPARQIARANMRHARVFMSHVGPRTDPPSGAAAEAEVYDGEVPAPGSMMTVVASA